MARYVQAPFAKAEEVKQQLLSSDALHHDYAVIKEEGAILFPIRDSYDSEEYTLVERQGPTLERHKAPQLKDVLKHILSSEELAAFKSSFDIVGSIAILELDDVLSSKEQDIAQVVLDTHKQIKTVVAKNGIHEGEFRTQQHRFLAGEETFETVHRENGISLYVNINNVYFSMRLATERNRIAQQIAPGERILVMFSGAAPYVCVLCKQSLASEVVGVEKNPEGHVLAEKNIALNHINHGKVLCGDVREVVPTLGHFDRIIMPLPKHADDFLDVAVPALKQGGRLHVYDFVHEELMEDAKKHIQKKIIELSRHVTFRGLIRCGQQSPRTYRICIDCVVD